jgi:taurine dioxygenase
MAYDTIQVRPLSGALGAEIEGVDLSRPLDERAMADVRRAFLEYLVIFFPNQDLTPAAQKDFARKFGDIYVHRMVEGMADHPDVIRVVREPGERINWGSEWHMDAGFEERPPLGTMLHAREIPPYGSDTLWANLYMAYEALSEGLKRALGAMRAVHASGTGARYAARFKGMTARATEPSEAVHPVVRVHPETGRKCLFVNNSFMVRFDGMTAEESAPLMRYLFAHSVRPEFTCRFRWKPGTLAFWDNRCTQHNAIADYFPERSELFASRRVMHRVTIQGDRPA